MSYTKEEIIEAAKCCKGKGCSVCPISDNEVESCPSILSDFIIENFDNNNPSIKKEFDWEGFVNGDFGVRFQNDDKYNTFMKSCKEHNLKWADGGDPVYLKPHVNMVNCCIWCEFGDLVFSNNQNGAYPFSNFVFSKDTISNSNSKVCDTINPAHYRDGKIEVIEYIEDKKLGFCLGNAVKYISRAGKKHSGNMTDKEKEIDDLKKAKWYIERRISEIEKES